MDEIIPKDIIQIDTNIMNYIYEMLKNTDIIELRYDNKKLSFEYGYEYKPLDTIITIPFPDLRIFQDIEILKISFSPYDEIPDLSYLTNLQELTLINKGPIKTIGQLPESLKILYIYTGKLIREWGRGFAPVGYENGGLPKHLDLSYLVNLQILKIPGGKIETLNVYSYNLEMLDCFDNNLQILPDLYDADNLIKIEFYKNPFVDAEVKKIYNKYCKNKNKITMRKMIQQFIDNGVMEYNNDFVLK